MNISMMTVFAKVGLVIFLFVWLAITENPNEVKKTLKYCKNDIRFVAQCITGIALTVKDEIKSLGFSRLFSFRGKH